MNPSERLVDQVFGRLQVMYDSGYRDGSGRILWLCQCQCGNGRLATCVNLSKGEITECLDCAKQRRPWSRTRKFHDATLPPSAMEELGLEEL